MQLINITTLLPNALQPLRHTRRTTLLILGVLVLLFTFQPEAQALDFDPETVQVSDLFPADSYVNPKDFGATGDGVTDDTAAVLAAIDTINANRQGVLLLEDGEFYCPSWPEDGLRINVPMAIQGQNVILRGDGSARLFDMGKQFIMEGIRLQNWRLGVEFRRVGSVNNYDDADWVIIRDNSFESVNHPIHAYQAASFRAALTDDPNPHRLSMVLITRNAINNARSGIRVAAIHVNNITISHNSIENLVRMNFDSDPDVTDTVLNAISIGQAVESTENNQKISNVQILNNTVKHLRNYDPVSDRVYGIVVHRGPDRVAGNWLQNFHATTDRVMGIYTRSASDSITEYNTMINVSYDYSDTPTPSRGAISSKKPRHLNHLVRGNTIIFTDSYKEEVAAYRYAGMLLGNHNVEYRDNLLIGCVEGAINTWRLGSNETSFEVNLIFDDNILVACSGDAFSNFFGRKDIRVINNTLIRHNGSLFHHGSFSESNLVDTLHISGNRMLQHEGSSSILITSGSGMQTNSLVFENNVYQHIKTLNHETINPLEGGGGILGPVPSSFYNENSVFKIENNTILGLKRDNDDETLFGLRLYAKIHELSISENFFQYGMRLLRPEVEELPNVVSIRDNHIQDWSGIFMAIRGSDWGDVTLDLRNNTGDFSMEQVGAYEFESEGLEPRRDYPEVPSLDTVATRVAERIHALQDKNLKAEMREQLGFLIGEVQDQWTFQLHGHWGR